MKYFRQINDNFYALGLGLRADARPIGPDSSCTLDQHPMPSANGTGAGQTVAAQ